MAVNAFHQGRQPPVEAEERVAAPVGIWIGEIGQFELVPRNRVPQVGECEEAVLRDTVEQFLDDLLERHLLGRIGGHQPDIVEGVVEDGTETLAQAVLALAHRRLDQLGQPLPLIVRYAGHGQALGGAAQMLGRPDELQAVKRPLDRPFARRQNPFNQIERVGLALVLQADFLQIEQQLRFHRPASLIRFVEQGRQNVQPLRHIFGVKLESLLHVERQAFQVLQSEGSRVLRKSCGSNAGRLGVQNGGADDVPFGIGPLGVPQQLPVVVVRFVRAGVRAHDWIRRTGQPGLGEKGVGIEIEGQELIDQSKVADRGEIGCPQIGPEIAELQVNRGKFDVGPEIVARREQVLLFVQDAANFLEFRPADLVDAGADGFQAEMPLAVPLLQGHMHVAVKEQPPVSGKKLIAGGRFQPLRGRPGQQNDGRRQQAIRLDVELVLLDVAEEDFAVEEIAALVRRLHEEVGDLVLLLQNAAQDAGGHEDRRRICPADSLLEFFQFHCQAPDREANQDA